MPAAVRARLLATVPPLLPAPEAATPSLVGRPGGRLLIQRSDEEFVAVALGEDYHVRPGANVVRFPAPWPRRIHGLAAVAPDAGLAVFAGMHAVRAVEPSGAVRWEVRHGCWSYQCSEMHRSYAEYADDPKHRSMDSGSVGFSADGRLLWAHVRGPLADLELPPAGTMDEWLVLDAADGRLLARADAQAAAVGSEHLPHPTDPGRMALSIGEGQDGAPLRWGRWDGRNLAVDYIDEDLCLLSVSPSGERFFTVTHRQETLGVHMGSPRRGLGSVELTAEPPTYWEWAGGFVDETRVIASTFQSDGERGVAGRHWLIDLCDRSAAEIRYPTPAVDDLPRGIGGGAWRTVLDGGALQVWGLGERASGETGDPESGPFT